MRKFDNRRNSRVIGRWLRRLWRTAPQRLRRLSSQEETWVVILLGVSSYLFERMAELRTISAMTAFCGMGLSFMAMGVFLTILHPQLYRVPLNVVQGMATAVAVGLFQHTAHPSDPFYPALGVFLFLGFFGTFGPSLVWQIILSDKRRGRAGARFIKPRS